MKSSQYKVEQTYSEYREQQTKYLQSEFNDSIGKLKGSSLKSEDKREFLCDLVSKISEELKKL